jgi:Glycosyltransferase family 87
MSKDEHVSRNREENHALWDPGNAWPSGRKWIWAILTTLVVIAQGPSFLNGLRVTWKEGNDFFQDWASARNAFEGRPAYLPLSDSVSRYFPKAAGRSAPAAHLPWNAHPPTSVVAILPIALLDYPQAGTLWNALSLIALAASVVLIARELNIDLPAWSILPTVTLGLLCSPLRTQISQGQWNAPLLLLLTLAWVEERQGRDSRAGIWIGIAATLKLFPIFFLFYFAIRRRWRAVIAGFVVVVTLSLITVAFLGLDAFPTYFNRVLPTLDVFRSEWDNASLLAFWTKNLAAGASHYGLYVEPVIKVPVLARAGIILSYATVLATTFLFIHRSRTCSDDKYKYGDLCYSLTMVTMLLLVPICWDHYLLLLALPLALVWRSLGQSSIERMTFLLLITAVWIGPTELWRAAGVDLLAGWPDFQDVPPGTYRIHRPFFVPVFLSLHFYALLASFLWLVFIARRQYAAASV